MMAAAQRIDWVIMIFAILILLLITPTQ